MMRLQNTEDKYFEKYSKSETSSDREVMNLRFAFLVTGKYLDSALGKIAYVDDSRKEHCMWKCHGTGDPGELQSDVNLQYFLLVTEGPYLALNKIAYECVKQNTACGKSIESLQYAMGEGGRYTRWQYIFSHIRHERVANKQSLSVMDRCVSRWTQPSTSFCEFGESLPGVLCAINGAKGSGTHSISYEC